MPLYVKNKNRKTVLTSLIFALAIGMLVSGWFIKRPVFAQSVSNNSIQQISLSASLFNNENRVITNGEYEIRFGIYSKDRTEVDPYPSNTDASLRLWEETQKVEVKNGIFRVFLGSVIPLPETLNFESGDYYIGMRIGDDSEMTPRKKLGSVPRAVNSQFLQGKTIGTQSGNIPVLGNKGKLNIKNLPTGTGSKQLVLGNDGRLHDAITLSGDYDYLTLSGQEISLGQINLTTDITGTLPIGNGGTGLVGMPTNGQLLIGNGSGYSLAALTEGTGIIISNGVGTITLASTLGTSIEGSEITDDTIEEADLETINSPTDGYLLKYDSATGGFLWAQETGGSGSSKWTDLGTLTYLSNTTDDLAIGGNISTSSRFFFDVTTGNQIILEGTGVDDAYETTLVFANPTADRTLTFPNETGTVCTTGSVCTGYQASGSYANTALSNLASVAINTSLISDTNNTDDLGSDAIRWRDLFLGPNTLHIGTSTTDEGTISYDTTGNIFNFSTDTTTNADIAFFTDDLYLDKSTGSIGIGTTAPAAGNILHVAGQCVTADTRLRRRRKARKGEEDEADDDGYIYDEVMIKDIKPGDEIASMDQITGALVWSRVNDKIAMGVQNIYKLVTQSGREIKTTANHPYFVRTIYAAPREKNTAQKLYRFEVDQSVRFEEYVRDTVIALANSEKSVSVSLSRKDKRTLRDRVREGANIKKLAPAVLASAIVFAIRRSGTVVRELIIDTEYLGYEKTIITIIRGAFPHIDIHFAQVGKKSPAHFAAYGVFKKQKNADYTASWQEIVQNAENAPRTVLYTDEPYASESYRAFLYDTNVSEENNSVKSITEDGVWTQISELKEGQMIAVAYGNAIVWERIKIIKEVSQEFTYDIEIEGTRNFIGNDIVAHNTYISGNVGIGYSSPSARLDIAGDVTTASIGSEMVTSSTDRDFTGSIGNWTAGSNWSYGTNNASHTAGTTGTLSLDNAYVDPDPVSGNLYQITFTVNTTTAGTLTPSFGSANGIAVGQSTGVAGQTQVVTATGTGAMTFTPNSAWAGTIDDVSVKLITPSNATQIVRNSDNTIGLEIRSGGTSDYGTFIGVNAGKSNTSTGDYNSFIGYNAGYSNTTGVANSAMGYNSLYSNTGGYNNSAQGAYSLYYNTIGFNNTAMGYYSLWSNTTGNRNTALGVSSLVLNTTGYYNTALGYQSLYANTTGINNSAVGTQALYGIPAGSNNTAFGYQSGYGNFFNSFSNNSLFGYQSGYALTTGGNNVFVGYAAGDSNTSASYNTFIGVSSGQAVTTGTRNTFLGYQSGYLNTASDNTLIGYQAGDSVTSGNYNTFVGVLAGQATNTGTNNIAIGHQPLYSNTTGTENSAMGTSALYFNTTGYSNTAIGYASLYTNTTGYFNTALGYQAGIFISDDFTANATSNNSLYLGRRTKALADGDTNEIVIGALAIGLGSNTVVLGNDSITKTILKGNVGIGETTPASLFTVGSGDLFQVNSSGAIAAATGLTTTGNITISGAQILGGSPMIFEGTTDDDITTTLAFTDPTSSNKTITFPNETGTVCTTGSVCTGYQASGSYANTALSNLASVAINTSLLPGTDDSIDLGSDTYRWRDLYLGPATLHIGTSTTDEGTLSYNTTSNILNFDTDTTANGDIAFFTDDLYLDKSTGSIGIGTTAPSAGNILHVAGQCVTADTRLRRRRRRKQGETDELLKKSKTAYAWDDEYVYEYIEILYIKKDDEIASLDQKTGQFVWSNVNGLLDMGIQPLIRFVTMTGRSIRTTAVHPYFVRTNYEYENKRKIVEQKLYRFEVDQSIKIETFAQDSVIAIANEERSFAIVVPKAIKQRLRDNLRRYNEPQKLKAAVFASAIVAALENMNVEVRELAIDSEYCGYEKLIASIIARAFPFMDMSFTLVGKKSPAHFAAYGVLKKKKTADHIAVFEDIAEETENALRVPFLPHKGGSSENPRASRASNVYDGESFVKGGKWTAASELHVGQYIAVAHGKTPAWERIVGIELLPAERVYDVEIDGTHNFVANDIVAHNTYISGNVGIGTTSPATRLAIQGTTATDLPTYGSELLTSAGWTVNAGWTESPDDTFAHAGGGGTATLTHSATISSGAKYQISWTVTGRTAGSFIISIGGASGGGPYGSVTATGSWGPTTSSTAAFTVTPTTDFDGTISLTSLKQITAASTAIASLLDSTGTTQLEMRGGTALYNTFVGKDAGAYNTTGYSNSAMGYGALSSNTTGRINSAMGVNALSFNTTGDENAAFGNDALKYNTTGARNVAMGANALSFNTTGYWNSAIGMSSLYFNTTGFWNSAVGYASLYYNTTGAYNSAMGNGALYANQTGNYNTAVGYGAGQGVASNSFSNNSLFGYRSGYALTTGSNNILLGYQSGDAITTGANNILLGYDIDAQSATGSSQLSIGNLIFATGGFGTGTTVGTGNVGIGDTTPDQLLEILSSGAANTQLSIGNTNAGDYDSQIGFELADGTNTFTMGVDDSDSDKFKISTTALGTNDRFVIDSSGNVGIGISTPLYPFHVAGQCVTADTRLRRRRKARKGEEDEADEDGYIYDEVMIKDIKPGDEIASMDQITGALVWKQVNGLLNMGIKPIHELITVAGKSIRTTAEHPYFVRGKQSDNNDTENATALKQKLFRFEVDQSIRIEEYTKDTIVAIANSEQSYAVIVPKKIKQALRDTLRSKNNQKHFEPAIFASAIVASIARAKINAHELVIDIEYPEHEDIIIQVIKAAFPHISIHFAQVGKKSPAHYAAYGVYKKQKTANDILAMGDLSKNTENALLAVTPPHIRRTIRSNTRAFLDTANVADYEKQVKYQKHLARTGYWTVVSEITAGEDIAVVYGDKIVWERIAKINKLPAERVYDVEIDGTHNFVANDIVAHNTYIGSDLTSTGAITFPGLSSDGSEATAVLINGSNQLVYRELGSNAFTSGGYANTALSNLASVAINTSLISDTNNTDDLGSDAIRWRDLFLGPNTLHIGTSTTDEGTLSYNTTSNILNFDTDTTANGDIAFFTDDLYLDKSTGYVGIGTASPSSVLNLSHPTFTALTLDSGTGGSSGESHIYLNQSGTTRGQIDLDINAFKIRSDSVPVYLQTFAQTRIAILQDGLVGIGTTSPLLKLDVAGSGRFTGTATSVLTGSIDATASTAVVGVGTLFTTELVVGDRITVTGETRTVAAITDATNLTVDTAFTDTANDTSPDKLAAIFLARDSSNAVKMVVNDLGNVGIGTTSPEARLHINLTSNSATAATETANKIVVYDDGAVTSGTDYTYGNYTDVRRYGAAGGTFSTYGQYIFMMGNTNGVSTQTGNSVNLVTPADTNYGYSSIISTNGGTSSTNYGLYSNVSGSGVSTTIYGLYSTVSSGINGTAYALYADAGTGAGVEYAAAFMNGNVGIGTTAPNEQLEITGNLRLPTSTATTGIIKSGANRFIHNYGTDNFFAGVNAGNLTLSGATDNIGIGVNALDALTGGDANIAIGTNALGSNTGSGSWGSFNVAIGHGALSLSDSDSYNVAIGGQALQNNNTDYNTAVGFSALASNTWGFSNVAFGSSALYNNQTESYNTAVGMYAGFGVASNSFSNNSLFGYRSGYALTTGSNNILLGYQSGDNLTTGANNILLGYDIDAQSATGSSQLSIGNLIFATGGFGTGTTVGTGNVGIGDTSPASLLTVGSGDLFQVNSSGAIAAATGFTTTGNITVSGAQILGGSPMIFEGATDDDITTIFAFTDPTTSNKTITFPNETGTVCTTGSVCSGYQASGSYANTALSNLASVAINTSLISDTNNTDDLGSDAIRWKDLFLGPNTLHIGSSSTDEGTLSYNTTSNILNFDTDTTANGDIAFFTDDLYLDKSTGSIGIGTTAPAAGNILHVAGQCVTADTRLRRRRRKKKGEHCDPEKEEWEDEEYIYDLPMIKDIRTNDDVRSLDMSSGLLEWKKVNGIIYTGIQNLIRITTQSGRSIRTTAVHPYFVRVSYKSALVQQQKLYRFEVDQSVRFDEYSRDTMIAIANEEQSFVITIPKAAKQALRDAVHGMDYRKELASAMFGNAIALLSRVSNLRMQELVIDTEYTGSVHESIITAILKGLDPELKVSFTQIGKKSPAHKAAYGTFIGRRSSDMIAKADTLIAQMEIIFSGKTNNFLLSALRKILWESGVMESIKTENALRIALYGHKYPAHHNPQASSCNGRIDHSARFVKDGAWVYAENIKVGQKIAVAYGDIVVWEKVVNMEHLPAESVYDVEIDGTHNFVANDIVAHNTYISGNVGIGTTSPATRLAIQGTTATDLPTYGTEKLTSAGWTVNAGWTESPDDTFAHTGGGGTATLTHSATISSGAKYQISWTVTGRTAGSFTIAVGGQTSGSYTTTSAWGPTTSSTASFTITPTTDFDGTISLTSLKQITAGSTALASLVDSGGTTQLEMRAGTALYNTFVGKEAGKYNTTGPNNTAIGNRSLYSNTTGTLNTASGYQSLFSNTSGYSNIAIGVSALYSNTTGNYNTAIGGYLTLYSNTTGSLNTAIGESALYTNTSGGQNSAIGVSALRLNTTGAYNTTGGYSSLYSNQTGSYNTAVGHSASYYNQTGSYNTAIGMYAGQGVVSNSFSNNSLFGYRSGYALTTGSNNILLGYQSGDNLTSGANNILLGYDIDAQSATGSSQLSIGNLIFATGGFGTGTTVGTGNVGIGDTTPLALLTVGSGDLFQVNSSGAIAAATGLTTTGNITVSGAQILGGSPMIFEGTTDDNITTTLAFTDPTSSNKTITFPNETGTVCTTGSICSGYQASGSYANTALSNLASVAINTSLISDTNNTDDLGSDAIRWRDLFLGPNTLHIGSSSTDEGTLSYNTTGNIFNFSTDSTTNGDIAFFTDDLYLDKSTGYVGIGTTSPGYPLQVIGAGGFYTPIIDIAPSIDISGNYLRLGPSGDKLAFGYTSTWDAATINTVTDTGIRLAVNDGGGGGTLGIQINKSGLVGIGTTSPLLKLDVAGSGRLTGTATSVLTGSIDPAASTAVVGVGTLFTTELVVGDRITVTGATRTVTAITDNTNLTVDTAFSNNANDTSPDKLPAIFIARDSSNAVKMVVNDLGNVGIGTTAPDKLLELYRADNGCGLEIGLVNSPTMNSISCNFALALDGTVKFSIASNAILFYPSGVETVRFASSGNVGIGDTSPAAMLTVGSGDLFQVNSSGAIVAAAGFTTTGNITVSGAQILGGSPMIFEGATDDDITTIFAFTDPTTSNKTITFPNETGTVCTTGSVCSGYQASGSYANTALSNLASVAINTSLISDTNNTDDLGSDAIRWKDLFLGPNTLHIGSSSTDEGTLSYNTTSNILNFDTDTTANGDIAFFTDDLYLDKSTGYVGVGTTSPTSGTLHVARNSAGNAIYGNNPTDTAVFGEGIYGIYGKTSNIAGSALWGEANIAGFNGNLLYLYKNGGSMSGNVMFFNKTTTGGDITGNYIDFQYNASSKFKITSSAVVLAGSGSVSSPTYSFISDTNTGIYSGGVDILRLTTGSSDRMTIDATGNVGIGDTSPAAMFTVGSGDLFQVNSSGAIAAATGLTTTGNITVSGAQILGGSPMIFEGATDDDITTIFAFTDPTTSNKTITFPNETGTVCTTGSVCSGYQASGSYANTALSNLASVAINTSLISDTNNTDDLGSDAIRWRDLFLGPNTLHIGSSSTDEGTLSYNTTSNILNFDTDSTANGDIAFFTDDLYLDKSTGYVGIGTTTPGAMLSLFGTANKLRLGYDASNYADIASSSTGTLDITTSATGESVLMLGDTSSAIDTSVKYRNSAQTYYAGLDGVTSDFMIGTGTTVGNNILFDLASTGSLTLTGSALTTTNFLTLNAAALTTAYAETININGTTTLTTGGAINIDGPTGAAVMNATTGLVNISTTGAITNSTTGSGSGSLLQITANGAITPTIASISNTSVMTTTGKLLDLTANAATTTTGLLTMNATGLNSGYAMDINVNGAAVLTSGGAINIDGPTGAAAQAAGALLKITTTGAVTGTAGSGNSLQISSATVTGTVASISDTAAMTTTGNLLTLTANSATTATGLLTINSDALTSGKAFSINSASTALTGSLQEITLSGSNAANTGSLLLLTNSGSANANTTLTIQHDATGTNNLAFRVNDEAGDTTPFVIDGSGNVGIGDTTPLALLTVGSGDLFQVNSSGAIAAATGLTTTGNITISGAQILGGSPMIFEGTTDDDITTTLAFTDPTTSNKTITFPNETGTVCTTGSVCSGYQASGSYANTALSNLASVAINTSLISDTNNTDDLGSDAIRWKDLFLGPNTLHIGTSITDEGTLSYDTTGNIFNFSTDSTTNGDIAFFTDDLYLDKSTGYVGINTTSPGSFLSVKGNSATDLPTYGSELLTSAGWTVNAGWTESPDDTFAHAGGGGTATLTHSATIASATKYQISWTVTGRTAGSFTIAVGGQTSGSYTATSAWGPTTSSTASFTITPTTDFDGTISLTSLKQITAGSTALASLLDSTGTARLEMRANSTTNNYGTFIGVGAGQYNTTGTYNTGIGVSALQANTTGYYNSAIGYAALFSNTTGAYNSAIGMNALRANTTGVYNTAVGLDALTSNTTGFFNSAIGNGSLYFTTTGFQNSAMGYYTLFSNTTGAGNSAMGKEALLRNQTGSNNTAVGTYAGQGVSGNSFSNNSLFGYQSGYALSTGSNNILLGYQSGDNLTSGANNILLGYDIDAQSATGSSQLSIGNLIFATGGFGTGTTVGTGNVGIGTTSPATKLQLGGGTPLVAGLWTLAEGIHIDPTAATTVGRIVIEGTSQADIILSDSTYAVADVKLMQLMNNGGSTTFRSLMDAFGVNKDNILVLNHATGNVGIGYSSPAARLDIIGDVTTASLGAEMITSSTDRDFTGSIGNWTAGSNWAYGTNNASHTAGTTGTLSLANTYVDPDPVSGNLYQIVFTIDTTTAGTLTVNFGGGYGIAVGQSTGTLTAQTQVVTATGTGALTFTPDSAWAGTIDDVSVKLITPSNATQIVRNSNNTIGLEIRSGGTGLTNTFIGTNSGKSNTTGTENSAIGYNSLYSNITGYSNSAIGSYALTKNTTGYENSAQGVSALQSNTNGYYNSAQGAYSLQSNTTGYSNSAQGAYALQYNTTGVRNSAQGANALQYNTTGSENSAQGYYALNSNATGSGNAAFGNNAGRGVYGNSFSNNSLFGYASGYAITTGSNNIMMGYQAGDNLTTGANNILLGYDIDAQSATGSSQLSIGNLIFATGGFGTGTTVGTGNVGIGDTTPSYKLEINTDVSASYSSHFFNDGNNADRYGIQIQGGADDATGTTYYINALDGDGGQIGYIANTSGTFALTDVSDISTKTNVVTAEMNATSILDSLRVVNFNRISDPDGPKITGFIAQEVDLVYPNAVTVGPTGLLGISKDAFIPVLVKAFQESDVRLTTAETSLSDLNLKTDQNITTLSGLQASVDTQLTIVGTTLADLELRIENSEERITNSELRITEIETLTNQLQLDANTQSSKITLLETQMQTLTEQLATIADFYETFELGNVVVKDSLGNVDLLEGKLKAKILETGGLVIEVIDAEAPTIGTAEILPTAVDADNDGNDDYTDKPMTDPEVLARDGKFIKVMTKAMTPMVNGSRIFTTFKDNPSAFSWIEKIKDANNDYVGFQIRLSAPITAPVKVDWLLVEEK